MSEFRLSTIQLSPRCALLAGAMTLAGANACGATGFTYKTIKIATSQQTNPIAINDSGTVAGQWLDDNGSHGFIYAGGKVTTFDVPKAFTTYVTGLNATGEIVGYYLDASHNQHGFIRSAKGIYTTVDLPGSLQGTSLNAISNSGLAVGTGEDGAGYQEAFIYNTKGVFKTIIDNRLNPVPTAINNQGSVAGFNVPGGTQSAFLYSKGALTVLPTTKYVVSASFGMNKFNEVVGQAATGQNEVGLIYPGKGNVAYIRPKGSTESYNLGVNDSGVIVGVSYDVNFKSVGFTWTKGVFATLSVPGGTNASANGINNAGQVIGTYFDAKAVGQAFLATPVK